MRNMLFAILTITFLVSCRDKKNKIDLPTHAVPQCDQPHFDSLLIPMDQANSMIQRYHDYIHFDGDTNKHVSFELDANALRCGLNNNRNISKLDVYLAMTPDSELTLVYVCAYDSAEYVVEQPYMQADGSLWVMDNTIPCPKCEKISIRPHLNGIKVK